jgi:putative transposase
MKVIGNVDRQKAGRWLNNRAENSDPLPGSGLFANHEKGPFGRRERAMLRVRRTRTLQKFIAAHASVHNHFNQERHLYSRINFKLNRTAALSGWHQLSGANFVPHRFVPIAAN